MTEFYIFFFIISSVTLATWYAPRAEPANGIFLLITSVLFTGLRANSNDYNEYASMFEFMRSSTIPYPEKLLIGKDILFGVLMSIIFELGLGFQSLFMASAILSLGIKYILFKKIYKKTVIPFFCIIFCYYILHDYTQIRIAISIGLYYFALIEIQSGNKYRWLFFAILSIGFHSSVILLALLHIPNFFNFQKFWKLFYWILIIVIVNYFLISSLENIHIRTIDYISDATKISYFTVLFIIFKSIYFAILLKYIKKLPLDNNKLNLSIEAYHLQLAGAILFFLNITSSNTIAYRFFEMFDSFSPFILTPILLTKSHKFRILGLIGCALSFSPILVAQIILPYELISISNF